MEPRRTSAWSLGSAARIAGAVCALGLGACQQMQVRAVVQDRPLVSGATLETAPLRLPPSQPQGEGTWTGSGRTCPRSKEARDARMRGRALAAATLWRSPRTAAPARPGHGARGSRLCPARGSRRGARRTTTAWRRFTPSRRSEGFSDTVIQLKWRESIRPGLSITGGATSSASRTRHPGRPQDSSLWLGHPGYRHALLRREVRCDSEIGERIASASSARS